MTRFPFVFLALLLGLAARGATPTAPAVPCGLCYATGTNDSLLAVPLESTEVRLDVRPGLVEAEVTQTFTNHNSFALEATYLYPLPDGATLTDFELRFRDRVVRSVVKEKAAAKETYEAAKAEGKKAALLEQHDPSLFSTAVANFLPGETVHVVLRYIQPLDLTLEAAVIRFSMVTGDKYFPGGAAAGMTGNSAPNPPRRPLGDRISGQHFYAFDVEVAGLPVEQITSESHRIAVESRGADRFAVRLSEEVAVPDRDFLLRIATRQTAKVEPTLVTQRRATGDYGLLTLFPPVTRARSTKADVPRDILFLVDCSGSMEGTRIEKARRGVDGCLAMLRPADRFQIVPFGSEYRFYSEKWVPADRANLARGREYARKLGDLGGTEMQKALEPCLDFFGNDDRQHLLIFLTDGDVGSEATLLHLITEKIRRTRLFTFGIGSAPNAGLIRRMAELGRGQARFIADDAAIDRELTDLFATLEAPVLSDLSLTLLDPNGVPVPADFLPAKPSDVFLGRPLQVSFRAESGRVAAVRLDGVEDDRPVSHAVPVSCAPLRGDGLEKQFGKRWYEELAGKLRGALSPEMAAAARKELLETALFFGLVTELTSRVAVEQRVSRAADAPLVSQTVEQEAPADQAGAGDEIVVLSPFEVSATADSGYAASSTMAGTRIRTQLSDISTAITVVTSEFLRDVAATNTENLLSYVSNSEVGGVRGCWADTSEIDGLPFTTLLGRSTIERLEFSTKVFVPTEVRLRSAGGRPGQQLTGSIGDGGALAAEWSGRWRAPSWGQGSILAQLEWSRFEQSRASAHLSVERGATANRWSASAQWRDLGGYGEARWLRAGGRRELAPGIELGVMAAWHELQRDDPWQFARDSKTARVEDLGVLGLDLLTAPTRRLSDRFASLALFSDGSRLGDGTWWAAQARWHQRRSDWADSAAAARSRDDLAAELMTQRQFLNGKLQIRAQGGVVEFRPSAGSGPDIHALQASVEVLATLNRQWRLFARREHGEDAPWLSSGRSRFVDGILEPLRLPLERREVLGAGVKFKTEDDRYAFEISGFDERRRNESFREWSWERDHGSAGDLLLPDGTLRSPISYGVRPHARRTGWTGTASFDPAPGWSAVLGWYEAWRNEAPYVGGARRASLVVRRTWRLGGGRALTLGGGAANRDRQVFDDGFALPGGTKLAAFAGFRWRAAGGVTEVRLNLDDFTDRPWPQTRFSPDRGRQFLLSVTREF